MENSPRYIMLLLGNSPTQTDDIWHQRVVVWRAQFSHERELLADPRSVSINWKIEGINPLAEWAL